VDFRRRGEDVSEFWRAVNNPPFPCYSNRVIPLPEASLLTKMNLLAFTDETDHRGPALNPAADFQEILWFRCCMTALVADTLCVPGALRFVVDPNVLDGSTQTITSVLTEETVDILYEYRTA
jgi:hypothetical protein